MTEYSIILKPVYSCPAEDIPPEIKLPANLKLSWHQLETWKALQNKDIDVIFNTAMTGDGKSLAGLLKALQEYFSIIGLYPTNGKLITHSRRMESTGVGGYPSLAT